MNLCKDVMRVILWILIGAGLLAALLSCSSQKRLQRSIEKHGIKESIGYVQNKYPEYFKGKDTTIHDTIVYRDTITLKGDTVKAFLEDSSGFLIVDDGNVHLTIDTATKDVKIVYKEKRVPIIKTIHTTTKCPEIKCPDCDNLQDNTKQGKKEVWYYWVIMVMQALIIAYLIFKRLR